MPGGDDAGMDGAFGTQDGAYPLICTIQPNVLANFRSNITTYLSKCDGPKRAVIATSQGLTNPRRRNLNKAAAKLGVTIDNIYDASYFANALYRNPKWRLDLVGIAGDLPALSALPKTGRFASPKSVVGRDDELAWLKTVRGDVLLVGQPGSGKTYLHQYLAAEQQFCLFAVSDSIEKLADAIRMQQPSIIVVDDAHLSIPLVEALKRMRAEMGASYSLHLNCWPSHEPKLQRILDIPDQRVRRLRPLRKFEIFDLIKQAGIYRPDWLQHFLISQSDGKPGLAAVLADKCKNEGVPNVWSGEAMATHFLSDLRLVRDEKEKCVLAAFAIGGDVGMSFTQVSKALELTMLELREITAGLGSGGIVEELEKDRLQVRPPAIRPVLVRDVFFCGARSLPIDALLVEGTYSPASTAKVLFSARQRGANINQSALESFLLAAQSRDVWEHFAWIDELCAAVILDRYPEQACHAAPGLLHFLPARALNALLDMDEQGESANIRRQISVWLFPFEDQPEVTVERRFILLDVLEERVRSKSAGPTFAWALSALLQSSFEVTKSSPGLNEVRFIRGVASDAILKKIADLWPRIRELLRHVPNAHANVFLKQVENWCLPTRLPFGAPPTKETLSLMRKRGRQMIVDILEMSNCNRAWRNWASRTVKWGRLRLHINVDRIFELVFGERAFPRKDWQSAERKTVTELRSIADSLNERPINDVLRYLADMRAEACEFEGQVRNGFLGVVYHRLAERCQSPSEWLARLIVENAPCEFVIPFVDRVAQQEPRQYVAGLTTMFEHPEYQPFAVVRSLCLPEQNEALLDLAYSHLNDPALAKGLYLVGDAISTEVMKRLLEHPNPDVRSSAAIGEWRREPSGKIRPPLETEWRIALRDVRADNYALIDIFENDPSLAFDWLKSQLETNRLSGLDMPSQTACKGLKKAQRAQLLQLFTNSNFTAECFDLIIGCHVDLYAYWLRIQPNSYLRLIPLDREVDARWESMALLALDAGVSPEELASHSLPHVWGWTGNLSQYYTSRG